MFMRFRLSLTHVKVLDRQRSAFAHARSNAKFVEKILMKLRLRAAEAIEQYNPTQPMKLFLVWYYRVIRNSVEWRLCIYLNMYFRHTTV